jgi:four helix bundle protein
LQIADWNLPSGMGTGTNMDRWELEDRTKRFALAVIVFTQRLPHSLAADVMGRQLLRSGTAIGALYREAARAETRRDFVHKVTLSAKEAAETEYWLALFAEAGIGFTDQLCSLKKEADELLRILLASGKTARARLGLKARSIRRRPSDPAP